MARCDGVQVHGVDLDAESRCAHYRGDTDIIAIKMKCCGEFYACKDCHAAIVSHEIQVWPEAEFDEPAIRCGACGMYLTIRGYLEAENQCPACQALFNPKCRNHHQFYFQGPTKSEET